MGLPGVAALAEAEALRRGSSSSGVVCLSDQCASRTIQPSCTRRVITRGRRRGGEIRVCEKRKKDMWRVAQQNLGKFSWNFSHRAARGSVLFAYKTKFWK